MYTFCKLLYITLFTVLTAAQPYLPLYYDKILHFSSNQIGFAIAIAPFVQSVACPLWTYLVDRRPAWHGVVMALTTLLGGVAVMGILGIGHRVSKDPQLTPSSMTNTLTVHLTCICALAYAFFTLPNASLVDSAVMKILGPNKFLYGEQRLWGSIATGLTILVVGQLISYTNNLDSMFWVYGASTVCFVVCALATNVQPQEDEQAACLVTNDSKYLSIPDTLDEFAQEEGGGDLYTTRPLKKLATVHSLSDTLRDEANEALDAVGIDLGLAVSRVQSVAMTELLGADPHGTSGMFLSVRVLTFLATTFMFGVVLSILVNFLFLFLNRDLHMPTNLIGWTGPVGGITELVCFCFAKQMTEWMGVTQMMVCAHTVIIFRCLAYTWLQPDSVVSYVCALLLQSLHGAGFAIFWVTSVSEIDSYFPTEQRAVAQGVLGALHYGLGTGLGALLGGSIGEYLGTWWMFRIAALLGTLSIAIYSFGRLDRFDL